MDVVELNTTLRAPTASVSLDQTTVSVNETLEATATTSDGDGTISSLRWAIDGETVETNQTSYSWVPESTGEYTLTLTVVDDDGLTTIAKQVFLVETAATGKTGVNHSADLDGDGLHEDVNGDGVATISDVQALFANRNNATVQDSVNKFDFTGNNNVNIVDVQRLFVNVTSS
ncbi:hypothetical protein AUR66_18220 [Haloferax profundi]|uniref:PKD domain-containing protein n=1 Tax=Haloferax profundi TaxID=1544718 RepID=A0A0W1RXV1_9EURY|nr:hypothetical protein AUR66_18220 [Haloferax profundi]